MRVLLSLLFTALFFASCSLSKKLERSAREDVLRADVLKTAHVGISVYEPATGKWWYNYQGDKYFVPASNTKIPTCYAAMKYLGDSLVGLRYATNGDTIFIHPSADPTFLNRDFGQPVYDFLKRFSAVFIQKPLYKDFLGSGWSWNDYKEGYMAQRSNFPIYGNVVSLVWSGTDSVRVSPRSFATATQKMESLKNGFDVLKSWETNQFLLLSGNTKTQSVPFRPDIATIQFLLADTLKNKVAIDILNTAKATKIFHSQPTDSLLCPMMHRSDNFFAEQSLLMVSNELLGFMNDEKIIDTLLKTDFKDLPQKPRWVDGSGLSRYNLFTPQDFVFILNKMRNEFGMPRLKTILATGGEGTLSHYYVKEKDFLYAKTGSLSGVVALSGFLTTKQGKELIFSVQVNNHNGSATEVRRAVEKFVEELREHY